MISQLRIHCRGLGRSTILLSCGSSHLQLPMYTTNIPPDMTQNTGALATAAVNTHTIIREPKEGRNTKSSGWTCLRS